MEHSLSTHFPNSSQLLFKPNMLVLYHQAKQTNKQQHTHTQRKLSHLKQSVYNSRCSHFLFALQCIYEMMCGLKLRISPDAFYQGL